MPSIYPTSPSHSTRWKRFYSSTSLIDPRKKTDISTWIILAVALSILASAFIILFLVWRNQRNARKEALEGEVGNAGMMTFGEEYGVDLCKVNDKFRQFAEEEGRGTTGTEMGAIRRTSLRTARRPSSPLSGKTLKGDHEIVAQRLLRCLPVTPATPAFGLSTPNRHSMQPILTCTPDRSDRESTVERELMEIERAGRPRGGWWSNGWEESQELPRSGSRDFGLQMIPSEELCSSPSDITPEAPKGLATIFQSRYTTPAPAAPTRAAYSNAFATHSPSQPIALSIPASVPQEFQGLPSSPLPYVNAPLPAIPPRAGAQGRSPAPAPINTFRAPKRLYSDAIEDGVVHAAELAPGHHYSRSEHRKYSTTPLPAIPGHPMPRSSPQRHVSAVDLESDYSDSEDDEKIELREIRDFTFARDPSPEPELGMGRQMQIRKSSGKLEEWSPTRLSQCPTAVATPGIFSPVFVHQSASSPPLEHIRSRSPSRFSPGSPGSVHPLKMKAPYAEQYSYSPEPLPISTDTVDDGLHLPPSGPLPAPPTPRTQQAQAVGAAMVQLLNGRIQQHKLIQMQKKPSEGGLEVDPVRAREISEVQSLAWAEKRGWASATRIH
ncbi:hypothetical protein E2P81_ATG06082 [Venturia nashicola]|uniref:Uncharacterized protein n=1 Tax=Venturia nashicola TaxID=86259 RepID=A0A4Z1NVY6_9PEZI|nr:hypothetical protein E6O75_ATG06225 [Venturia nashicola]TLD29788.1 hypothetical protein E2P81_ATG06082 [Venturia nashicola]